MIPALVSHCWTIVQCKVQFSWLVALYSIAGFLFAMRTEGPDASYARRTHRFDFCNFVLGCGFVFVRRQVFRFYRKIFGSFARWRRWFDGNSNRCNTDHVGCCDWSIAALAVIQAL